MTDFNKLSKDFVSSAKGWAKQGLHASANAVSHAADLLKGVSARLDKQSEKMGAGAAPAEHAPETH
jgi:hypothetical protein